MKISKINKCIFLFCSLLDAINVQGQERNKGQTDRNINNGQISQLDLLIEDLEKQQWAFDEILCSNKVLNILNNVKNSTLWATWIWDSMQSPTGIFYGSRNQFGSYDQCMKAPWLETRPEFRTKYCLADIKLSNEEPQDVVIVEPHTSVKTFINFVSKYGVTFNVITSGVCVPVECNSKAISKIIRTLFEHTHLGLTIPIASVSIHTCDVAGAKVDYSTGYYFIMFFLAVAVTVSIICTILNSNSKNHPQSGHIGNKIVGAFCMTENIKSLYKVDDDDIASLHGLRSITTGIAVTLHVWVINNIIGYINLLDVDKTYEKYNIYSLSHAALVVDASLMMSGLLLIKGLMASNKSKPLLVILKRYLRYLWLMGMVIIFFIHVFPHMTDGPIWHKITQPYVDNCRKNWWITMLMLGNYVDTVNTCYPILWTVPCEFHLSVVAILIFSMYKRNRRLAFATFTILFVAAIIMPGVVTYQNRLPTLPYMNISSFNHYQHNLLESPTYLSSHLRAGPYLVGIAVGYLISIYKLDKRRNIIPTPYALTGFVVSFGIALKIMTVGGIFQDKNRPYHVWEAALFASFNRTLWAIAIVCAVAFCEYGTVPFFSSLLQSQLFLPLSKLAYGTYLLHPMIYFRIILSTRTPLTHDMCLLFFNTFGLLVFCVAISLFVHLLFVAPMNNLINIISQTKRHQVIANGTTRQSINKNKKKII